jgi:hypothetical protein
VRLVGEFGESPSPALERVGSAIDQRDAIAPTLGGRGQCAAYGRLKHWIGTVSPAMR